MTRPHGLLWGGLLAGSLVFSNSARGAEIREDNRIVKSLKIVKRFGRIAGSFIGTLKS
jgi:hypothetical protein